jgi:hypothetical protein
LPHDNKTMQDILLFSFLIPLISVKVDFKLKHF